MKKEYANLIDLAPRTRKTLEASEYVDFVARQHDNIKSTKFVLPKIGSDSFGVFEVELTNPIYELCD